jgi:hypothetical protein
VHQFDFNKGILTLNIGFIMSNNIAFLSVNAGMLPRFRISADEWIVLRKIDILWDSAKLIAAPF